MSTQEEPDFPYNPQTGECDAPKGNNWGTPQNPLPQPYAPTSVFSANAPSYPVQPPGGAPSPRTENKNSRSRKDRTVTVIYQLLRQHYYKGITPRGAQFLINRQTFTATPLEADGLVSDIQSLALNSSGIAITPGEVELALGAIRGDAPDARDISSSIGLTVPGRQGELFLLTPDGVVEISAQGGYRIPPSLPEPIGFVRLENARSPIFSVLYGHVPCQPLATLLTQLNVPKDSQLLVLTWLVNCLIHESDNVLLEIVGGRYSGKTTLQSILKLLIDPSLEPLITDIPQTPARTYDLAKQDCVISLDKVKVLSETVQEALLALLQGKLTDIRSSKKNQSTKGWLRHPIVINGAESKVTLPELADRSVLVQLPQIEAIREHFDQKLGSDNTLQAAFASLVVLLSGVHAQWKSVKATECPAGMVDFYRIGIVVAEVMGGKAEDFDQQMKASLERRFEMELYEYPVVAAVRDLLGDSGEDSLEMPVGELFQKLNDFRPDPEDVPGSQWPRNPRHLGEKLADCSALMEAYGMRVGPPEKKGKHGLIHRKIEKCTPQLYRARWDVSGLNKI